jgi:limonene-1,2-epoxide hydrolase
MSRIVAAVALCAFVGLLSVPHVAAAGEKAGDVVMLDIYSADAVFEDVNQRHHFEGTDRLRALLSRIVAMHHRIDLREKRRVVHGNVVVVEYEYAGFLNGAVLGQSVGKEGCPDLEYTLPATSWYEIENSHIVRQRDFIDMATLLEVRETLLAGGAAATTGR